MFGEWGVEGLFGLGFGFVVGIGWDGIDCFGYVVGSVWVGELVDVLVYFVVCVEVGFVEIFLV